MFHCDSEVDIGGTYFIGSITATPPALKRVFGEPKPGDGAKVYGEYSFTGPDGAVFTLYDWKEGMNLWGHPGALSLHIGGNREASLYLPEFTQWLTDRLGG